jgi:excinuclease ABC subunit B
MTDAPTRHETRDDVFRVVSDFDPAGDQPVAIGQLAEGIRAGERFQTLLGITGSGKSATIAWTIQEVQRPTLILAPNKSLAAQLAQEMREFFPNNRVEYFVSYYDYYQPEAYIPSSDTYIEKDSSINDEIDRLRHSATAALLTRRDVIVVASVSCIYGMGNPEEYRGQLLELHTGVDYDMRAILRRLVDLQYDRNDMTLGRGKFRVRGDTIEIHPAYEETVLRVEMFGDTVDRLTVIDTLTGETLRELSETLVFPATHYVTGAERIAVAMRKIEAQAARGPAAPDAHAVRPGDDVGGRVLQRHRELLDAHRRPHLWRAAVHTPRLLPRRLPAGHRREPRRRAAAARPVRR